MTPDPAAVAALRIAGCPWSLGIDGDPARSPSPGLGDDTGVTTPVQPESATERPNVEDGVDAALDALATEGRNAE